LEFGKLSIQELLEGQRQGKFNAREIWEACLQACQEDHRGAFLRFCPPQESGNGPLQGVPVAISDEICVQGVETTAGSRMLAGFIPPYQGTVVEKLRQGGALLMGKTNVDEFALGPTMDYGPQKLLHPHDAQRSVLGSAGGAAVAVATHVTAAVAADVGGGVRLPAASCDIVGFIPTYGRISRYGVIEHAPSLDQVGIMARRVADVEQVYRVIAGHDPLDSTSLPDAEEEAVDPKGCRIGIIAEAPAAIGRWAEDLAAKVSGSWGEVQLESLGYGSQILQLIVAAEASSNLGAYDGMRFGWRAPGCEDVRAMFSETRAAGFGARAKLAMLLGAHILNGSNYDRYYLQACRGRTQVIKELEELWSQYDVLLTPTIPEGADDCPRQYTSLANLAGIPAITIPCSPGQGLQLMAPRGGEELLLRLGEIIEGMQGGGVVD
jgi:aspartyl-tRNA(Asn)/glutamyl-tRNA(Gln) amidotransferase subunit A